MTNIETQVRALATELARVRQRGIAYVDRTGPRHQPVRTPMLDSLLRTAGEQPRGGRAVVVGEFLNKQLTGFAAVSPVGAELLHDLLYDTDGRAPGRSGPGGLLRRARKATGLSDDGFHHMQRDHFVDFARFLLTECQGGL